MPTPERRYRESRSKTLPQESRIIRALGTPDEKNPAKRKYRTDKDVARAVFADRLARLSGAAYERELTICVGEIVVARSQYINRMLHPKARADDNVLATNDYIAIRNMYKGHIPSSEEVIELVKRPKPQRSGGQTESVMQIEERPFNLLEHLKQAEIELAQAPLGSERPRTEVNDLHYERLPDRYER